MSLLTENDVIVRFGLFFSFYTTDGFVVTLIEFDESLTGLGVVLAWAKIGFFGARIEFYTLI